MEFCAGEVMSDFAGLFQLEIRNCLVSVRGELESNESFMIPWGGLILEGGADVDE